MVAAALAAEAESDTELSVGSIGSRTRSRRRTTDAPTTSSRAKATTSARNRRGKTPKEDGIQEKPAEEKVKSAEEEKVAQREELAKDDQPTEVEGTEHNEPREVETEEAQKTR